MRGRCVPPDDEVAQRQLPPEQHPGRDEAYQGQGRGGHHLRAYHRGRQHVLRQPCGQRPGGVQEPEPRHHRQPLRHLPRRREGKGVHEGYFQERLEIGIQLYTNTNETNLRDSSLSVV